jgi:phosphohistidine swiveling domain-containing protein
MAGGFVRDLAHLGSEDEVGAGGKAFSLGRLRKLGLPVPDGIVLLATAFDVFLDLRDLRGEFEDLLRLIDAGAQDAMDAAERLRVIFAAGPLPPSVEEELVAAVGDLSSSRLAVRSSATVEDSARAAWAGQFTTSLNVHPDDVPGAVLGAWASLFSERTIAYAQHRKLSLVDARVAVIVQELIDPSASGVIFTADPVTQDTGRLVLEAVFGLGETLVSGSATPDTYWLDKKTRTVLRHRTVVQSRLLAVDEGGGTRAESISPADGTKEKLTANQVDDLTQLAIAAEHAWACPLDIEWCIDKADDIFLLQARPVTTLDPAQLETRPMPQFAPSITRGWSLLFCQVWHRAYTQEFVHQFGWGLSDVLYEGVDGLVHVYRAPSEFVAGMTDFVTAHIDAQPDWLQQQAAELIKVVDATRSWLATVLRTPLSQYTSDQLLAILDEFVDRNAKLGPRYVLMLWYPIQIEQRQEQERYAAAVATAIEARVATHSIGGTADDFARRIGAEVLRRNEVPEELARVTPLEMLRRALSQDAVLPEHRLQAYNTQFLVTKEGVLHESADAYCARRGIPLQPAAQNQPGEDILAGVSAYPGKARGPAKIIRGRQDFQRFKPGDVLITAMTTPDFEVIMSDASGIVTDEGGATSHAAILARELRKPTVIGTQVATQLFADEGLAEVNADDGMVQKVLLSKAAPTVASPSSTGSPCSVMILEDTDQLQSMLYEEFYRQANTLQRRLTVHQETTVSEALASFRRQRDRKQIPDAVVVDLLVEADPYGGLTFVEELRANDYPAEQIYVFSAMATAASKFDAVTRRSVFGRLEAVGVSRSNQNVFGKIRPGEETIAATLKDDAGELATITQLVSTVLTRLPPIRE